MFRILLASAITIALLSSCQKNYTSGNVIPTPINTYGPNDSFLVKYVETDTTQPAGLDTTQKLLITYDAQKRLSSMNSIAYNFGVPSPADSYLTVFFYNGTDSLPYKSVGHTLDPMTSLPATIPTFYTFAGGRPVYDSTVELNGYNVHRFFYYPNHIVDSSLTYNPSSPNPISKDYQTYWLSYSAGNLSTQVDTLVSSYNTLATPPAGYSDQHFIYDNKKNPFNRIGLRAYFYDIQEWSTYYGMENNNFSETNMNYSNNAGPGHSNFHFIYRYEYNAADYPKIVRITDLNSPTDFAKGYFYYTSL